MRNMATIREIDEIVPIEGRDRIVVYQLGGWNVIGQKFDLNGEEVKPGTKVLYFEVDTILNQEHPAFTDVAKRGVKTMTIKNMVPAFGPNGEPLVDKTGDQIEIDQPIVVTGHVLKTIKMAGVYSQGMTAPLSEFNLTGNETQEELDALFVDQHLAIKFELDPLLRAGKFTPGNAKGEFPAHIRKTDSERVQNIKPKNWETLRAEGDWVASEKIDGTSTTFFTNEEGLQVASRNWWVEMNDDHKKIAEKLGLADLLEEGEFVQGELAGPGIQGNKLDLEERTYFIFTVHGNTPERTEELRKTLAKFMVPELDLVLPETPRDAVEQVNGMKSTINPRVQAEGAVWWNRNGKSFIFIGDRPNFKAINNKWLLKNES